MPSPRHIHPLCAEAIYPPPSRFSEIIGYTHPGFGTTAGDLSDCSLVAGADGPGVVSLRIVHETGERVIVMDTIAAQWLAGAMKFAADNSLAFEIPSDDEHNAGA